MKAFDLERLHVTRKKIAQKINLATLSDPTRKANTKQHRDEKGMVIMDDCRESRIV